jgi:hypothetical protein
MLGMATVTTAGMAVIAETMVGVVMDPGGLTAEAMGMGGVVVVGIRVTESMSAQAMANYANPYQCFAPGYGWYPCPYDEYGY